MAIPSSIGQKLEKYYEEHGETELKELQMRSNKSAASLHPIAILTYSTGILTYVSSIFGSYKELEVQFYKGTSGTLSARIYELFEGKIKRKLLSEVSESNIYHTGWVWDTNISSMTEQDKKAFISSIATRKIHKIQNDNIYLY